MNFKQSIYFLAIFLFLSCVQNNTSHKILNDTEHLEVLKKEIISGKDTIRFEDIMNFEWESVIILTPYCRVGKVEKEYNIDLSSIAHFMIEIREDINLIVFLKNNKPTRAIAYPRYPGDFSTNEMQIIQKSKANFKIGLTNDTNESGAPWIILTKQ